LLDLDLKTLERRQRTYDGPDAGGPGQINHGRQGIHGGDKVATAKHVIGSGKDHYSLRERCNGVILKACCYLLGTLPGYALVDWLIGEEGVQLPTGGDGISYEYNALVKITGR
jgi:hypothetical protein